MAGHMGAERVTIQNLRVVSTDPEVGLIAVEGAVPGSRGSYVLLSDAIKKSAPDDLPFPAAIAGQKGADAATEETLTEEALAEEASAEEALTEEVPAEGTPADEAMIEDEAKE